MRNHMSCRLLVDTMAARGWTTDALAARAGVAARTVCRYRRGVRRPEFRHVTYVAKVLELDPRRLWSAIDTAGQLRDLAGGADSFTPKPAPQISVQDVLARILVFERLLQAMGSDLHLIQKELSEAVSG